MARRPAYDPIEDAALCTHGVLGKHSDADPSEPCYRADAPSLTEFLALKADSAHAGRWYRRLGRRLGLIA